MDERKYIIVCRRFDSHSAAACPCVGQIATNCKMLAYYLFRKWTKWSYKHYRSIAVELFKRNSDGTYDIIKR